MKKTKNKRLVILLAIVMLGMNFGKAQKNTSYQYNDDHIISFDDINLSKIIIDKYDSNGDKKITYNEVKDIKELHLAHSQFDIHNLKGIKYFTAIEELFLNLHGNENLLEISNCKNLKRVRFYGGIISDLSFLKELNNIEELYLGTQKIVDISPIGNLKNLKILELDFNQITNINPLKDLTKLEVLLLNHNKITALSPLSKLENLKELNISSNQNIENIDPIKNLKKLIIFQAYSTKIKDIEILSNLNKLEILQLNETLVNDISAITNLNELRELWLNDNKITSIPSDVMSKKLNLYNLQLKGNSITEFSFLNNLKKLQVLNLWDVQITDVKPFLNLNKLYELFSNKLSDNQKSEIKLVLKEVNIIDK